MSGVFKLCIARLGVCASRLGDYQIKRMIFISRLGSLLMRIPDLERKTKKKKENYLARQRDTIYSSCDHVSKG